MNFQTLVRPTVVSNTVSEPNLQERIDRLSAFVQCTLRQSYSNHYSTDQRLQLLDQAWTAQKLLWQLRQQA